MNFFKAIFNAKSNVSSRRVIAVWFAFVVIPYIVYNGLTELNAYDILFLFLGMLVLLLGITTVEKIVAIWKGTSIKTKSGIGSQNPIDDDEENDA